MSDALYERYKDALRRGHIAAAGGRADVALEAYGEAATIAPDRSLPYVGMGRTLSGVGRPIEALAAYDAALDRAPADEVALRARVDILLTLGRPAEAADTLDRLAAVLDAAGRLPEATDVTRRGLELAESRGRRRGLQVLAGRLAADATGDQAVAEALGRASSALGVGADAPGSIADGANGRSTASRAFDAVRATAVVEDAVAAGDRDLARAAALDAVAGLRASGRLAAAIDMCYLALAGSPGDPDLHLALTEVYLDLGWRALAIEKLVLLARMAALSDDAMTRSRLCGIIAARLPGEDRLVELCA
jgi:tetratricopeptide (TPR) repeat protein